MDASIKRGNLDIETHMHRGQMRGKTWEESHGKMKDGNGAFTRPGAPDS